VATAGDVNGDGYADVIVGAPYYANGQTDEGRASVYHGSASGLSITAKWTAESDQADAKFGNAVATAGDVNGDGFADVIVGAPNYDNGQTDEGRASVYHGSAGGLSATPNWTSESDQDSAKFGNSVAIAGDVNGDGYADVIVGAPNYDNGQTDEGRVFVYHGSASGLSTTANWTAESDQASAYFGYSVATAGDVNGDGYADVIVGAPNYDNGQADEGRAFVYYGNGGRGVALRPRQLCTDGSTPIAHLGMSDSTNSFILALTGKTPFGRGKVTLEYEIKPLGVLFNGQNTITLPMWLDTGIQGIEIPTSCSGLSVGTPYHWRVRLQYNPATTPFQQRSRWLTMPWNGWQETKLKTNQYPPAAPSNLQAVGTCTGAILTWTDNSKNETGFQIKRASSSSGPWYSVTTVPKNATTYTDSYDAPTNCYIVMAVNEVDYSASTDAKCADLLYPPAAGPSGLSATAVSSTQINLSWTDNSNNETGFKIERAPDSAGIPGTFAQIATVGAGVTSYANTDLAGNTKYWYRVRAYNACADSMYSNNASATTQDEDTDRDGIQDSTDNCPAIPNGPELGTCLPGSEHIGLTCTGDSDCGTNGNCSTIQEDSDVNGVGDVCDVPWKIRWLVRQYYLNILDREPDTSGLNYWAAEIDKIINLGIYVGEGFQALARFHFNSPEYLNIDKNDTEFLTDIYETFLQRPPDQTGLDYWRNQLNAGLTRNMVITQFANSPEFVLYMQNLFGPDTTRPENNLLNDFYRGILNVFPDQAGFNYYLGLMRIYQCNNDPAALRSLCHDIALSFVQSAQYQGRNRDNKGYIEDVYNAILRRSADATGFLFWVDCLENGPCTRESVLQNFTDSPEFQGRVQKVIDAGCLP
jgi:hypothetical protein